MLSLDKVIYRIGARVLLDEVSMQVNSGQHVGLVGRNGCGKSTLFKLILKELEADGGVINIAKDWHVLAIKQETPSGAQSALEFVIASDIERTQLLHRVENETDPNLLGDLYERLIQIDAYTAESRAAIILKGLGFDEEAQNRALDSFSGGFRMRIALAAALFQMPDLLLLDEPTNHLDLEAVIWLKEFLKSYPKSLILISHDREMMNDVVDRIYHLQKGKLDFYNGNYDFYERTSRERLNFALAYNQKLETQRKHMQAFVDRFRAKASKAAQAQSRVKAIAKLEFMPVVEDDPSFALDFPQPDPLGSPLLRFEKLRLGYGETTILSRLNGSIRAQDRIALLGSNGNGKSTFAKYLAGKLAPFAGEEHRLNKLKVGYFDQHQFDTLNLNDTPIGHMRDLFKQMNDQAIRNHLGSFGFSRDKSETLVGKLSGGERVRLVFSLISAQRPNILVLDEPTNHLDVQMREALVLSLNDFEGAVILISHDWHLLDLCVDDLWLVADRTIVPYQGSLQDYKKMILGR